MRTTFTRFDKGLLLKVHRYTIVYYLKINCRSLTIRGSFPKVQRYAIIWFLIFNCGPLIRLILEKLFSSSSFHDRACSLILASGPHLDATNTSENILKRSSINAVIFDCLFHRTLYMDASYALKDLFGRSRIPPII